MPTLDELSSRISVLEQQYDALQNTVNGQGTQIHNLDTRLDTAETQIYSHESRLNGLDSKVADHESRLKLIEESSIKYSITREVKYPKKADQGFYLYMPSDLTIDILMEYNSGIIQQKWNWLNKIFNSQGFGKVSFDLDRNREDHIKTIVLGQNTRLLIPTGVHIYGVTPVKSVLKVVNELRNSVNKGLVYGIEIIGTDRGDEVVVSVFNPTSTIIKLAAGEILVQVLHLFSYHTVPQRLI